MSITISQVTSNSTVFPIILNNRENIKALHYWYFVRGILLWMGDSPHKGPRMQKVFPCYHGIGNIFVMESKATSWNNLLWKCHITLLGSHNESAGISDHQPHDCLLNHNHLFRHRSKKISKLRVSIRWHLHNNKGIVKGPHHWPFVRGIHPWPWSLLGSILTYHWLCHEEHIAKNILFEIHACWFQEMHYKMWSIKWQPFCSGHNIIMHCGLVRPYGVMILSQICFMQWLDTKPKPLPEPILTYHQ